MIQNGANIESELARGALAAIGALIEMILTCGRSKVKCHCMQLWDGGKRTF